jgi:hypothetical protein
MSPVEDARKATGGKMAEMQGSGTATLEEHVAYVVNLHDDLRPLLQKVAEQYPTLDSDVRTEFLGIYEQSADIETNSLELLTLKQQVFRVLGGMQAQRLCEDEWNQMQDDLHTTKRRVYDLFVYNMLLDELRKAGKESLSLERWSDFLVDIMQHDGDKDAPMSPVEDVHKVLDSDSEEYDDRQCEDDDESDSDEDPDSNGGGASAGAKRTFDAMNANHE